MRALTHERRFGAYVHEARVAGSHWPAHEVRAWRASHERLAGARAPGLTTPPALVWPVQRQPRPQLRHAAAAPVTPVAPLAPSPEPVLPETERAPAAAAVAVGARLGLGAGRPDHGRGHTRAYIHARHLARVRLQRELRTYHLAVRQWRHLLVVREQLLRKLTSLERRLARRAAAARGPAGQSHLPVHVYEIDGAWFRQAGRRRAVALGVR